MTPSDWWAITGIIATVAVTYHVAAKQHVFSRARVRLSMLISESREWPWAVVIGIPERNSTFYACDLPVFIEAGAVPLRSMWLQLSYPRKRHYSDHMQLFTNDFTPDFAD